ncbi:MAG TPA: 5-deoxy-glucuronate isomerase [Candidatus Lustribacter sp.]|nr:5-deoxy-glucuronate isomerase [Candidatus Lustribacter sp.]
MRADRQWVRPSGSCAQGGYDVAIVPGSPGWAHTGLYVVNLAAGRSHSMPTAGTEVIVVPLSGALDVLAVDGSGARHEASLAGRVSVFAGPTDIAYVPPGATLTLTSADGARVALPFAPVAKPGEPAPFRHLAAGEVPVELRGAGRATREVRSFGVPGVLDADSIIACEVVTPAGNWSSYPPHKHDTERDGAETALEEIYYFQIRPDGSQAGPGADPVGYQRVYGTPERPIDVLAEVRSGDVVLVPYGWHGPAMAPPGYDMYYLNVMAGPGPVRAWLICDDPAHAWVRDTWPGQSPDPRLPMGGQ